ncbi:3',5'-cyclic-nucleotide phosphodiesterase [Aureococcus anophagefferens]|nr:3',5'-cyclic-nucleotide phosphodiesterase [Aureococcus anophagefferens]
MKKIKEKLNIDGWHPLKSEEGINLILQIGLKCADISNQARPWKVANRWNEAVYKEFYHEGDLDRAAAATSRPLRPALEHDPHVHGRLHRLRRRALYEIYVAIMKRCAMMDEQVDAQAVEECLVFLQKNKERYQLQADGQYVDQDEEEEEPELRRSAAGRWSGTIDYLKFVACSDLFSEEMEGARPRRRRRAATAVGADAEALFARLCRDDTPMARARRPRLGAAPDRGQLRGAVPGAGAGARAGTVLPVLLATATDRSWRVRWSAAAAFAELAAAVDDDVGGDDGAHCAEALRATFVGLLNDVEPEVRAALASSVGDLAPALGRDATVARAARAPRLLRDANAEVRLNIISNLGPVHAVVGVDLLSQSLLPAIVDLADDAKSRDDPVANVRFNAAATLRKLAPRLQRHRAGAELALLKAKLRSLADDDGDVDVVAIASEAAAAVDGDE